MKEINPLLVKHIPEESFIKNVLYKTNWYLVLSSLALTLIGFLMIYSATLNTGKSTIFVSKQFFAFLIGSGFMIIFSLLNYQIYQLYYKYFYIIAIIMLILVILLGSKFRATRAWIDLGIINIQPTEIIKIFFIIFLAGYFDQNWEKNNTFARIFTAIILSITVITLILIQPDLSNAILYFPIIISIFYLAGVSKVLLSFSISYATLTSILFLTKISVSLSSSMYIPKWLNILSAAMSGSWREFFVVMIIILAIFLLIWWILKNLMFDIPNYYLLISILLVVLSFCSTILANKIVKPYQQKRVIAFINPGFSPSDAGYQVIQTRIAIGSGMLLGKGLFQGTQTQLGFVPEKHTDFIFSLIAEELGFIGSTIIFILYFIIITQGITIMQTSRDSFGSLLACGIVSLFAFYFVVNIGMCLGIVPVVGLPLPFVSYGGSNLVSSLMAIGLLNSIHLRKFIY